jgi:hypothetical protein
MSMSANSDAMATVGLALPWLTMTLDQTENLAVLIPEDKLDWRLPDPSGRWHFSLAEIVLHCADARLMFSRQLIGEDSGEGYWSAGPAPDGGDGVWSFRPYSGGKEVQDALKTARTFLDPFLSLPAGSLTEITDGSRAVFDRNLAMMKEKGADTAIMERRGPANIVRVLMAAAVHESGHRSTLQTLLRMHGIHPSAS